jgi:hypothetical protein
MTLSVCCPTYLLYTLIRKWEKDDPNFPGNTAYRTERVKSPGLLLLGLAKKLPSTPRVNSRFSASTPVMFGWNHLTIR